MAKDRTSAGFTLVELLIVAVVLAIFAAMVTTQFTGTTITAKEGSLRAFLATARNAIDRYHAEHGGVYPGQAPAVACGSSTPLSDPQSAFGAQLIYYTNADGGFCTIKNPLYPLGPYVKWSGGETNNPVTGVGDTVVVRTGALTLTADGPGGGFKYDALSGRFIANDTNTDSNGTAYQDY